ncbi:MAG TPA: hypothetical protein VK765_02005 [Solirubrobacteraceae bacterium]|nr:hypothetical protein [Solirubrobacteraceae bacterium]
MGSGALSYGKLTMTRPRALSRTARCPLSCAGANKRCWGLERELTNNTGEIIDRMRDAAAVGIPIDTFAQLVGVSRQKLYRWRDSVRVKAEAEAQD